MTTNWRSGNFPPEYEPTKAIPEHMPQSTYRPVTVAFGTAFILWGMVTSLIITAVGLVVFAVGLTGWIKDLAHE
jgi:hypothetical protein